MGSTFPHVFLKKVFIKSPSGKLQKACGIDVPVIHLMILAVASLAQYHAVVNACVCIVIGLDFYDMVGLQVVFCPAYGTAVVFDEELVDPVLELPVIFSPCNLPFSLLTET